MAPPKGKGKGKGKGKTSDPFPALVTMEQAERMASADNTLTAKRTTWQGFLDYMQMHDPPLQFPLVPRILVQHAAQLLQEEYKGNTIIVMVGRVKMQLNEPQLPPVAPRVVDASLLHWATVDDEVKRLIKRNETSKAAPATRGVAFQKMKAKNKAIAKLWATLGVRGDTLGGVNATEVKYTPGKKKKELDGMVIKFNNDKVSGMQGRWITVHCSCKEDGQEECVLHCPEAVREADFPLAKQSMREIASSMNTSSHGFRRSLALRLRKHHETEPLTARAVAAYMGWEYSEKEVKKKGRKPKMPSAQPEERKQGRCISWENYALDYPAFQENGLLDDIPIAGVIKEIQKIEDNMTGEGWPMYFPTINISKKVVEYHRSRTQAMARGVIQHEKVKTTSKKYRVVTTVDSDNSDFQVESDGEESGSAGDDESEEGSTDARPKKPTRGEGLATAKAAEKQDTREEAGKGTGKRLAKTLGHAEEEKPQVVKSSSIEVATTEKQRNNREKADKCIADARQNEKEMRAGLARNRLGNGTKMETEHDQERSEEQEESSEAHVVGERGGRRKADSRSRSWEQRRGDRGWQDRGDKQRSLVDNFYEQRRKMASYRRELSAASEGSQGLLDSPGERHLRKMRRDSRVRRDSRERQGRRKLQAQQDEMRQRERHGGELRQDVTRQSRAVSSVPENSRVTVSSTTRTKYMEDQQSQVESTSSGRIDNLPKNGWRSALGGNTTL